jgi:hypothetical protein
MKNYPIAKSDMVKPRLTPKQKTERKRKRYIKKQPKILRRKKIQRWERIYLSPIYWTWYSKDIALRKCPDCQEYKNRLQFSLNKTCMMCRKDKLHLPPIGGLLHYPEK